MREIYADVIVDISHARLDRSFQYRIPEALREQIGPGSRVEIPFGSGGRTTCGYVIACSDELKIDAERVKDITGLAAEGVRIESRLIRLAAWMRRTYGSTMAQALRTVLPVKEKKRRATKRRIFLAVERNTAERACEEAQKKNYAARERLLTYLLAQDSIGWSAAREQLNITADTVRRLTQSGLIRVEEEALWRDPVELKIALDAPERPSRPRGGTVEGQIELTPQQRAVCDGILREMYEGSTRPALIEGVTGSGKTLIYLELAEHILQEGKCVIVLIPEIALSGQTVRRFVRRFGPTVAVLHSRMSAGERSDQIARIESGEARIAIGPRSALFAPFESLGLIVIDEEHEHAYRNEEAPHYDAREVAIERANAEGAYLVLGSATPSIDSRYACENGRFSLFRLTERYGGAQLPRAAIVDMREELREGNRSMLSRMLREAIAERLAKKEQTMLFLNRRGMAGFLSCRSCGSVVKCPHCDVTLTVHRGRKLICHYCGYRREQPARCEVCGSQHISGFRAGTQQIEEAISRIFPDARVLRMDADTTRRKGGHDRIMQTFAAGDADILIGTQMIVKGHDVKNVTLVGILLADLSLFASDYRASERTYQLLVQALGRAGRGDAAGEAIVQTYQPENPCLQAAIRQDYEGFYAEEIALRELLGYPPAASLLAVHGSAEKEDVLSLAMQYIRKYLERIGSSSGVRLIGPAPESVAKVQDRYRQVLYAGCRDREILIRLRTGLEKYIEINRGFDDVWIQYDLNV